MGGGGRFFRLTSSPRPSHHVAQGTMAGKRRAPVEEEDFSDDEDDYEEDFGDDEEAGARGGDDEFDEDEDDELEAEMAALESIRRDKAGAAGGPDKAHINNKPGLKASIEGTRRASNNLPALRGSPPPRAVREPTPDPLRRPPRVNLN